MIASGCSIYMRNILAHRYFGIDVDIVWPTVENDLPELKSKVDLILQEISSMD